MNSSHSNPALPTWLFVATDLALIGAAAVIAAYAPHPLSNGAMLGIVGCVGVGAILGLVPLVARYERQKNEQLDERQRELEALARTVNASAEQISIAARGLHEIAELAQKNLRLADQLPHKLQDKIAEFQAQLAGAADAEKEELERELLALRTSESERLDSVSQRIAKSSAEWTKLESATHQHLTAANEAVAKLAFGTAGAIGKAQAAAEQALAQARVEAARTVGEASGQATRAIEAAKAAALADLDTRLATAAASLVDRIAAGLGAKLATTPHAAAEPSLPPAPSAASSTPVVSSAAASAPIASTAPVAPDIVTSALSTEAAPPTVAQPPKRPRKVRREDAPGDATAGESAASVVESKPVESPPPSENEKPTPAAPAIVDEPPPVPAKQIPEITPVAPATAEPFSGHIASTPLPEETKSVPPTAAPAEASKVPKKKAPKKPVEDDEPGLGLGLDLTDSGPAFGPNASERVLSSDGATRLLVTAYIGIGNRLFIRGQGPGLSWEKGVPLQFVSIGKWRWETNDASAPVEFKLYKNDDLECAALGAQSLDPGHQQEVTAAF